MLFSKNHTSFPRKRESSGKPILDNNISYRITAFKMVLDVLLLRPVLDWIPASAIAPCIALPPASLQSCAGMTCMCGHEESSIIARVKFTT